MFCPPIPTRVFGARHWGGVFSYLMAHKSFLQANKTETIQVQVHQGVRWILNERDLETQQQWCIWHKTGYEHVFDQVSRSNGFTWTCNTCIDLQRVDAETSRGGIMQALHYGAQQMYYMPTEAQQKLVNWLTTGKSRTGRGGISRNDNRGTNQGQSKIERPLRETTVCECLKTSSTEQTASLML